MLPVFRAHQSNEVLGLVVAFPEVELMRRQFISSIRDHVSRALLGLALLARALLARACGALEVLVRYRQRIAFTDPCKIDSST